ncbi:MAG: SBBP repeat-containing protein, partial [Bacteroidota bacterium]
MRTNWIFTILFFLNSILFSNSKGDLLFGSNLDNKQIDSLQIIEKKRISQIFTDYLPSKSVKFIENKGQMIDVKGHSVPYVLFKVETQGINLYITEKGLTYVFIRNENEGLTKQNNKSVATLQEHVKTQMAWVNVNLEGGRIERGNIIKEGISKNYSNYFYGHCPNGIYEVYEHNKITIKEVYPGIDWVFYNSKKDGMKYDFIVHPGADPSRIKIIYEGDNPLQILSDGGISVETKLGSFKEEKPITYEEGSNDKIESNYHTTKISDHKTLLEFKIANYNSAKSLIIDPQMYWYTFYGGIEWDECFSTDTDENGNIFVTGYTRSNNFPIQDPGGGAFYLSTGGDISILQPNADMFLLKFSPSGILIWATYYGDTGQEFPYSIEIDKNGNAFVVGWTDSGNFPVQNAGINSYYQSNLGGLRDAFILKFQNNGTRLWASYYGGAGSDYAYGLCSDTLGNIWITGGTDSPNFPTFNGGTFFQGSNAGGSDAFILKFDNVGVPLLATYYGGALSDEGHCVATDINGNVFVSGETFSLNFGTQSSGFYFQSSYAGSGDAFILKFSPSGSRLWASYYGGAGYDTGASICNDNQGNVFVLGSSESTNFPLQNSGTFFQGTSAGLSDAFLLKFDNNGTRLWATLMGGGDYENFWTFDNAEVDNCNNLYFTFTTFGSNSFPYVQNNINSSFFIQTPASNPEPIIGQFSNNGDLRWCSFIGGNGVETRTSLAIDQNNSVIFCGTTEREFTIPILASTFPLTNPGSNSFFDNTIDPSGGDQKELLISRLINLPLLTSINNVPPSNCNSCDGTITINITQGEGPYTYNWSNGITQTNLNTTSSTISNLCAGTYTCLVTDQNGCTVSTSTQVNSSNPPIVSATAAAPFCVGGAINLSASGGVSYSWSGPNGFSSNTQNPQIFPANINQSGTYSVTVSDANGCVNTASVSIQVASTPTVSVSTSAFTFNTSESVTLSASGANNFVWTPGGATGSTININSPSEGLITYCAIGSNAQGCQDST